MPWIVALWAALAQAQDYRDYLCKEVRQPFFQSAGPVGGPAEVRLTRRLANPIRFKMPKPPRTRRILVVGESVAAKFWDGEHDALSEAAAKAWPGWRVEDINAGMTAYNSRRIEAVLEEGLKFDPDLVIVMSGNNERDALELCPGIFEGIERQFKRTRLYRRFAREKRSPEGAARELSLRRHEFYLRRMAKAARAAGVPILFATLPANERDYAPAGEAPWDDGDFSAAMAALEAGRTADAVAGLRRRLVRAPEDAIAHWFLARALERGGDAEGASRQYREALAFDPQADRSSTQRNALIRRVAHDEGAAVADLEEAFHGASRDGVTNGEQLSDGAHWYPRLNPWVAARLLDAASRSDFSARLGPWQAEALAIGPAPVPSGAARREELKAVLLYGLRNLSYLSGTDRKGAISELAMEMLARVDGEQCEWLRQASTSEAAMVPLLTANYWVQDLAEDQAGWWPVYLAHLGEMYRRRGEAKRALGYFDQAVDLSPERYRTRLWRALALRALGRSQQAGADLDGVRAQNDPVVTGVAAAY